MGARAGIITPTPLATPEEIATYRRTTPAALCNERDKGTGPPYRKLNGRVFYDWAEVVSWVESNALQRTDGQPPTTKTPTTKTQIAPPLRT